jgi:hypothetical protein
VQEAIEKTLAAAGSSIFVRFSNGNDDNAER